MWWTEVMKILYFARVRQIVGRGEEQVEVPAGVKTVSGLIDFLKARDAACAAAFADLRIDPRRRRPGACAARRLHRRRQGGRVLSAGHGGVKLSA